MFDFRLATAFCLGYHLSKHKMTVYFQLLGGMPPWLRLWTNVLLKSPNVSLGMRERQFGNS